MLTCIHPDICQHDIIPGGPEGVPWCISPFIFFLEKTVRSSTLVSSCTRDQNVFFAVLEEESLKCVHLSFSEPLGPSQWHNLRVFHGKIWMMVKETSYPFLFYSFFLSYEGILGIILCSWLICKLPYVISMQAKTICLP
jgi:hypothetical protein